MSSDLTYPLIKMINNKKKVIKFRVNLSKPRKRKKMSTKGVRQLKELLIRYSDYDGSSKGILNWMHQNLVGFATANPQLSVVTSIKRNKHPIIRGTYLNGNVKTICIKNQSVEEINEQILHLRNQVGLKVKTSTILNPTLLMKSNYLQNR